MKIYTKTGDQGTLRWSGGNGCSRPTNGWSLRLGGRIDRFRCPAYGPFAGRCGVGAPCLGARTHCLPVDDCCCYAGCGRRRSGQGERNRRRGCEVSRRGDRPYAGFRECRLPSSLFRADIVSFRCVMSAARFAVEQNGRRFGPMRSMASHRRY